MKTLSLLFGTALVFGSTTAGRAQGCCTPSGATGHAGHGQTTAGAPTKTAAPKLAMNGAAKPVFENYLAAQASLAGDSMENVSASASALVQAVRADTAKTFPAEVASQAEALVQAKDLATARKAFQPLSESLIRFVKAGSIPAGTLYEVYCPMAKASWLQADKTVRNPYFGQAMLSCGQVRS
ncbi:MAG: DUF3347 domain-containing protein [Verrucomicrobiae bacterium]|nr:DUF3347 domain-containing protein [Verrucomicrobiae bacterium]